MDHGAGEAPMAGMDHGAGEAPMAGMDHGAGEAPMAGMDHGAMSMATMTRDLPVSPDGLRMERIEMTIGPLFRGLPGGLAIRLSLDGERVMDPSWRAGACRRNLEAGWRGPAADFPDRLARLDPLTREAYRALAWRALESSVGAPPSEATELARIGTLERERAIAHLAWLSATLSLLGLESHARSARRLAIAVGRAGADVTELRRGARSLARDVLRTPLLRRRLRGIGVVPTDALKLIGAGPVWRAAGSAEDARLEWPAYRAQAWSPATRDGNDALARLQVRLDELAASLDLVAAVGTANAGSRQAATEATGVGHAVVETPRGRAELTIEVEDGRILKVLLSTPSERHATVALDAATGLELPDALVTLASFDISPWELDR
jgi:Ni,Fe-hydrogenase III large subunit